MNDPRNYYLSKEVEGLLHGQPIPKPVVKLRVYDGHAGGWPEATIPVEFLAALPSRNANAGNDTFSVHTLRAPADAYNLRVAQSDSCNPRFSHIDREIAYYLHGH